MELIAFVVGACIFFLVGLFVGAKNKARVDADKEAAEEWKDRIG